MVPSRMMLFGLAGVLSLAAACSASTKTGRAFGDGGAGGTDGVGGAGGGNPTGPGTGGDINITVGVGGSGGGSGTMCNHPAGADGDGDGFTVPEDCNDCDANVNPGAIEVIDLTPDEEGGMKPPADEDCDGTPDNPPAATCDGNFALGDPDPMHAANAIELCQQATSSAWGVASAAYVRADGQPAAAGLMTGILNNFGPNVNTQAGTQMFVLSSGNARLENQQGSCGSLSCSNLGPGNPPAGFPQDVPNCSGGTNINDDIALEVTLKAPTNATGYSFNFKFYSFEYPEWVCTTFNDQFIALVNPPPNGSINGNISFDSQNNPVSVNVAFFDVCDGCPLGPGEMQGTGYNVWDDAGGTGWLKTQAPITGGSTFTIRWAIWDTGDTAWDSTAMVDNFQWIANGGTVTIGTDPIPDPL